jgi:hypothetical protein
MMPKKYHGRPLWPALIGRVAVILVGSLACATTQNATSTSAPATAAAPTSTTATAPQGIGQRTKSSGCVSANALPDPACTPGAILKQATKAQICVSGYSSQVRNVPDSEKAQVYAEYGIPSHSPGQYEVDHLISLELGGSNEIANLWPEPAEPRPGFHEKDQVENLLHDQVCSGAMPLQDAQIGVAHNWLQFYKSIP